MRAVVVAAAAASTAFAVRLDDEASSSREARASSMHATSVDALAPRLVGLQLKDSQQVFMSKMRTNMYRGVRPGSVIARRCRHFNVLATREGAAGTSNVRLGMAMPSFPPHGAPEGAETSVFELSGDSQAGDEQEDSDSLVEMVDDDVDKATIAAISEATQAVQSVVQAVTAGAQNSGAAAAPASSSRDTGGTSGQVEDLQREVNSFLQQLESVAAADEEAWEDLGHSDRNFSGSRRAHFIGEDEGGAGHGLGLLQVRDPNNPDELFNERMVRLQMSRQLQELAEKTEALCEMDERGGTSDVDAYLGRLREKRRESNAACHLPLGLPCYLALAGVICRGTPHDCRESAEKKERCCHRQLGLEAEIRTCEALKVSKEASTDNPSTLEHMTTQVLTAAMKDDLEAEVELKKSLRRKQHTDRKKMRQKFWRHQEHDLFHFETPRGSGRAPDLGLLSEIHELQRASADPWEWPPALGVAFTAVDTDSIWKEVWRANAPIAGQCSPSSRTCEYRVAIPCDAAAGRGRLQAGFSTSLAELDHRLFVFFDPWHPNDEFFANLTHPERHAAIMEESGGIWTSDMQPIYWNFDQFDPGSWQLALLMLDQIPLDQRSLGPRIVRWVTYLIPSILEGNWCSPPECYDDGVRPWAWTGSKPIVRAFMRTREPVKYAQCWVFAAVANTIYRSMGVASRIVTNYNSAHGSSKSNGGIDDFFVYDGPTLALFAREDPPNLNTIWSFHVWTEVFMRRLDLPGLPADGWQVVDSTPQEDACERAEGGMSDCRFMMGPASTSLARQASAADEKWQSRPSRRAQYDTDFLIGETNGEWRSWKPVYLAWQRCPRTCPRNNVGDGNCDPSCNIQGCDWDLGDCCEDTCRSSPKNDMPQRLYMCGGSGYDCQGVSQGWTHLYVPDRSYIGRNITTQLPGGKWYEGLDITANYKHQ